MSLGSFLMSPYMMPTVSDPYVRGACISTFDNLTHNTLSVFSDYKVTKADSNPLECICHISLTLDGIMQFVSNDQYLRDFSFNVYFPNGEIQKGCLGFLFPATV